MVSDKQIRLEAGSGPDSRVWIGAPAECYDLLKAPLTGREVHVLHFSVQQAEVVVQMLKNEIKRAKRKKKS